MSGVCLRECNKLNGDFNFIPWKLMLHMLMEEDEIWEHVEKKIVSLSDPKKLTAHNKDAKEK
jgi:hypothetical protein